MNISRQYWDKIKGKISWQVLDNLAQKATWQIQACVWIQATSIIANQVDEHIIHQVNERN